MPKAIEDLKFGDTIVAMHITGKSRIIGVVGRTQTAEIAEQIAAVHPKDEKLFVLPPQKIPFLEPMLTPMRFEYPDISPRYRTSVYTPTLYIDLPSDPTLEERQAEADAMARAQAEAAAEAEAAARARATEAVDLFIAIATVCITAATTQLIELDSGPRAKAPDLEADPLPLELE